MVVALMIAGCSTTRVTNTAAYQGPLPTPDVVVVYNFAVTPVEAKMSPPGQTNPIAAIQAAAAINKQLATEHAASDSLANYLVDEIQGMGLIAVRASVVGAPVDGTTLEIRGQFVSMDGQQKSVGIKGSNVVANVQIFEIMPSGRQLVDEFQTVTKSSFSNNVDADAKQAAQDLGKQINQMFNRRGWSFQAMMP